MTALSDRPRRRRGLSDKQVAALPRRSKRYTVADPEQRGHYIRVMPDGPPHSFVCVVRDPLRQIWTTIGTSDVMKIAEARERARTIIRRVKDGLAPVEAPPVKPDSFADVAENWLRRSVAPKKLRTQAEIERRLRVYVFPYWRDRAFADIRRSDIAALLDRIEDRHGARQADAVLGDLRTMAFWYATRNDGYQPPFVRGMRRRAAAGGRARILNDDELRLIWRAAEADGVFGGIVRLALLTAQRRQKILTMRWEDLAGDTWTIASAPREKGNAGRLKLPPLALDIIEQQPRYASNPYVFGSMRGNGCCTGIGASKVRFNKKLASDMPPWTLHDLRRTARSLMSRAGVQRDHAERVLGHVIGGVEGVYDRHRYDDEKAGALQRLADLIERIVNGTASDNVVSLRPSAQQ